MKKTDAILMPRSQVAPPIRTASWNKMMAGVRALVYRHLKKMARYTFEAALACPSLDGPGVYLLYDETGALLYVGEAGNLAERLKDHLAPSQRVIWSKIEAELRKNHPKAACGCGRRHDYMADPEFAEERKAIGTRIRKKMLKDYRVGILAGSLAAFKGVGERHQLEKFVQWVLQPEWGSWADGKSGWIDIPENPDTPRPASLGGAP